MPKLLSAVRVCCLLILGACLFVAGIVTWAFVIEPNLLFVRDVEQTLPQWQKQAEPVRVLVAGDFHFRNTKFDQTRAARYVQRIMQLKPDLIVLVGDYVWGMAHDNGMPPQEAARFLRELHAPYGVFAVLGNHDVAYGAQAWKQALTEAGIHVLSNSSELLTFANGQRLQLSGLEESHVYLRSRVPKRMAPDIPHILLAHRPAVDHATSRDQVDLIICGHTHGGQVCLPFDLLRKHLPQYLTGYTYPWHTTRRNRYLITKGLGSSVIPCRFNCPPEMYLLTLK